MDNRPLLPLAFLVVIGTAILTRIQPILTTTSGTSQAPGATGGGKEVKAPVPLPDTRRAYCDACPAPIRPLCRLLPLAAGDMPKDWRSHKWATAAKGKVRFLIVAVSDPDSTGDLLRFDRAIESIQVAVESVGYRLDRHWLPWKPDARPEESSGEGRPAPDEPGVLLFRSRTPSPPPSPGQSGAGPLDQVLMVFLVGESPVSGIQRGAFLNAVRYIRALSLPERPERIHVVGPNYSGSFPALKQAIHEAAAVFVTKKAGAFRVISASATVKAAGEWFRSHAEKGRPAIAYDSIVHNDDYVASRFNEYLKARWSAVLKARTAVLSESGTTFGGSFQRGEQSTSGELVLTFPREISRLRKASPEASARQLVTPRGAEAMQDRRLPLLLREPAGTRDSAPTFAKEQRPVAQEAVLLQIVATLRQERIALVQIVATDVFDSIFLSTFLRQACPDIRLYIANADMLFTRAAERYPLHGSLVLTTFPLVSRNQIWADAPSTGRHSSLRLMASRFEFGLFNACQASLVEQAGGKPEEHPLIEYSFADHNYATTPPLWLTAIGSNGYWPVALLDYREPREADPLQLRWPRPGDKQAAYRWPDPGEPSRLWQVVFWTLALGGGGFGLTLLLAQAAPYGERLKKTLLMLLAVRPDEPGAAGRACLLLAACVSVAAMLVTIIAPVWELFWSAPGQPRIRRACAAAAAVAMVALTAAAAGCFYFGSVRSRHRLSGSDKAYLVLAAAFSAAYAGFAGFWRAVASSGKHLEPFFFAFRSLDLLNGVSPALPFLLLGAGILFLTHLHFRRHGLHHEMAEGLPGLGSGGPAEIVRGKVEQTREALGHPLLSTEAGGWLLFGVGMIPVLFLGPFLFSAAQSLEGRGYEILFNLALLLLYSLVTLSWARFLLVWTRLHGVLDNLARHPIQAALRGLPPEYSTLPILQGRGRHSVQDHIYQSLEALRAFVAETSAHKFHDRIQAQLVSCEKQVQTFLSWEGHSSCASLTGLTDIHKCLKSRGDAIASALGGPWKPEGAGAGRQDAGAGELSPEAVKRGTEFIALQYVMFIGNAMLQLRNLLYYVTTGFFLGVVSCLVYPFRSADQLIWAATGSFVLLGAPVVSAIVQMERDETLGRLTSIEKRPGAVSVLLRLATYGALPILGLISSHFPAVGRYLTSLLEPAIQAMP